MPATLVFVLVLGAVAIGLLNREDVQRALANENGKASEPSGPRVDPFAHLPPDRPPERAGRTRRAPAKDLPPSPDDLLETPAWIEAVALAEEAEVHYEEAVAAKKRDDLSGAAAAGRLARERFDKALEYTALWEESLLERHGDRDPLVKRILRARNRWFDRLAWLRKSVGH